jgi:arylsulfatase A-like enzyme
MRNILFLLVDCLRADAVWGQDRRTVTPTIDGLISRGTYFDQAVSIASTTTTCVGSMLTGNYPFSHGLRTLYGYKLNSGSVTLPQVLQKHGYHTYGLVTGPLSPLTGLDRGFSEYHCRTEQIYLSDDWGENLRLRLKERSFKEPWFIFLHLWEIHKPRQIAARFDSKRFGVDAYERAVSSLDAELSRLLDCVGDDTIVLLHGDHGENREAVRQTLSFHFYHRVRRRLAYPVEPRFYKIGHNFHIYDFLIRVPLLFYGPGLFPAAKIISDQVRQIDVFPTLAEALGFDMPSLVHGRSLVPLMRGQSMPEVAAHVAAVGESFDDHKNWRVGIRTSEWKYAFAPQNPAIPEELYNLRIDPHEWRNVAKRNRLMAAELREQVLEMISGTYYVAENEQGEEMSENEKRTMEERLKQLGYL